MNKQFHQLAPIIALKFMPDSFKAFFIADNYIEEQLKNDADIPDMVDKDNITINAEIHHAHSYKLEVRDDNKLHWADGDVLERLKGLCADAHDFKAEGRLDMVRYSLAKMTHYRIDSLTFPHLHRGQPWSKYHQSFEDELGKFIVQHQDEFKDFTFTPYDDIYKACRNTALEMWPIGKDVVAKLEQGIELTDAEKFDICKKCIQGVGSLWTTLIKNLNL